MPLPTPSAPVLLNEAEQRFELSADGLTAVLEFVPDGERVAFTHTYVPPEWRGGGVAATLAHAALQEARRRGWRVVPRCSYVALFLTRHPEYSDLVAP
ncbi:MAG: N-acetyltransferase [Opitutaceae bacterium]|nr:N-acetyltransferase [Opitutaceae bacterium]